MNLTQLKINNNKDSAIKIATWKNPGAQFYDKLLNSFYCEGDIPTNSRDLDRHIKNGKYLQWNDYLKEAYLVAPIKDIKNSPYGVTPYSRSGCKYPHHEIKNGELVLSIPGIKAAYARAKQMNIYKGEIKEHLDKHIKELGDLVNFNEFVVSRYFNEEEDQYFDVLKSDMTTDFKPKGHKDLSEFRKTHITNELAKKYEDQGKLIKWMRDQNPNFDDECLIWIDDNDDYVAALTYDTKPNKDGYRFISGFDIAYKYQGYGLSTQLLDVAIKNGVTSLSVQYDNEIARHTYKKYGFIEDEKTLEDVKNGKSYTIDMHYVNKTDAIIESNFDSIYKHIQGKTGINLFENVNSNDYKIDNIESINESLNWIEQFTHDEEFRENSYNIMIELDNPNALLVWMNANIRYGWRFKEDNKVYGTNDNNSDGNFFYNHYRLASPSTLIKSKFGVCWDQVELERRWFSKHGIEHGVFYIELQDKNVTPTHTFLVYHLHDAYWWFEHSWGSQIGIKKYDNLRSLLLDVTIKHQIECNDKTSPIYISWLKEPPLFDISCEEYMNYTHSQYQLNINNLPNSFYENNINDNFGESIYSEASHGKLKVDYRLGWDYDNGHQIKVIYSLDNIKISDVGDFYPDVSGTNKEDYLQYTIKNIKKKGNFDHQSYNQKVLAIIDNTNNQKLKTVKLVNPFCPGINTRERIQTNMKEIRSSADKDPINYLTKLTVGQIDNKPSYKSTHWFTRDATDPETGEDLRFRQISKAEIYKNGRGHKINNLMAKDFEIFGNEGKYNIFHNPNKNQAYKELEMRELDYINFINHLIKRLETNDIPQGYTPEKIKYLINTEKRSLSIIQNDINKIKSGNYNVSMMNKYRESFNDLEDMIFTRDCTSFNIIEESNNIYKEDNVDWLINYLKEEVIIGDKNNDEPPELDDESSEEDKPEEKVDQEEQPPELPTEDETNDDGSNTEEEITIEDEQIDEEPVKEEVPEEKPKPESKPKQVDKVESDKNGVRRKKLYIAFIEWCKEYNPKNSFGSIFDKDIFKVSYPFIPEEMRYFYRLANPMLCVLGGDLTFFPVTELRKINNINKQLDKLMIFAATPNDLRVFNNDDKKIYRGTNKNESIELHEMLGDTFDLYIQKMINKGDILNGPIEESVILFNK